MGASPRALFRFTQSSRSFSIWFLLPEGQWACSITPDNEKHYCIHVRVTLGEGTGNQPLPCHAWSGSLIADMFQDALDEWITEAVVLAPEETILFFERWSHKEGFPYTSARVMVFSVTGPVNWAGWTVQVEVTTNMVQEGHQAIEDAVMEKRVKAREPQHLQGSGRAILPLAGACNVDDWMWGLHEEASNGDVRRTNDPCTQHSIDVVDDVATESTKDP